MSESPFLQPNRPVEIEGTNLRLNFRQPATGNVHEIRFEVDEETWQSLKLVPRDATIRAFLWWEPSDFVQPPKVSEAERGEHGWFYYQLFKQGFQNSFDLLECLNVDTPDRVRAALHGVFNTDSLTKIPPAQFISWAKKQELGSLVMMSDQIQREHGTP